MSLDEVAEKLGYVDAAHVERNIENYGEPLPQWWEVIKELVNKLPLNDVKASKQECYKIEGKFCDCSGLCRESY